MQDRVFDAACVCQQTVTPFATPTARFEPCRPRSVQCLAHLSCTRRRSCCQDMCQRCEAPGRCDSSHAKPLKAAESSCGGSCHAGSPCPPDNADGAKAWIHATFFAYTAYMHLSSDSEMAVLFYKILTGYL